VGKGLPALYSFNRGIVSKQALGRVDVEKLKLSAAEMTNWQPTILGPMSLRPGTRYIRSTYSDAEAVNIPFIRALDTTALLEFSNAILRPLISEAPITRASVSTSVTNGDFSSGTGWNVTVVGGAAGTISGGKLTMDCANLNGQVTVDRSVSVSGGDQATEHAFRIVIDRGPVTFRCGTTAGDDDIISQTTLLTGTHSLAFTPNAATVYPQFESLLSRDVIVDSITVEASGAMTLPTPYATADLPNIRWTQSADVVFIACDGYKQRRIERRATNSWSIVEYDANDGPFLAVPSNGGKLSVSAAYGNITITATRPTFKSTNVGGLFRIFTPGYNATFTVARDDTFTPAIRVSGTGSGRNFTLVVAGTFSATVTLQRSFDGETSGFADVGNYAAGTHTISDGFDNSIAYYRVGIKTGNYTSGTVSLTLTFQGSGGGGGFVSGGSTSLGGRAGIARITSITNSLSAEAEVLSTFSSTTTSEDWNEGEWSDRRGWPSAVEFYEQRLCWAGNDKLWASVSDSFTSFDIDYDGDAGPINRSIGSGPVQTIAWLLSMQRLLMGTDAAELVVKSSSFDEPLSPTNFAIKGASTQGSARIPAMKIDRRGVYVQAGLEKIYELAFDVETQDYDSRDLNKLATDILSAGVKRIGVQRQPDTRIHVVLEDGTVAILVYEPREEVLAWYKWETTSGDEVEDVCVLPSNTGDKVYYIVKRTINGSTKRYLERIVRDDECLGQPDAYLADCHLAYSGSAVTTITGLSHLEGETVVVWGWNTSSPFTVTLPDGTTQTVGRDLGTKTVSSGQITGLSSSVTNACVGLAYQAEFKSAKLAYLSPSPLTQRKRLDHVALLLNDTHCQGVTFGQDLTTMDALPLNEKGFNIDDDTIWTETELPGIELPGVWDTDARLCLKAASPRPATVAAAVIGMTVHEKA
jgi:hypothetical protein